MDINKTWRINLFETRQPSPIKAEQGNPIGGKGSESRQQSQIWPLFPLFHSPTKELGYTTVTYM